MGAGYVNLRKKRKRQRRKVGREEAGSSSNRPELAAFVLTLRGTPVTTPMLYFYDNQVLLKAVKRWVGECGKVISAWVWLWLEALWLQETVKELRKKTGVPRYVDIRGKQERLQHDGGTSFGPALLSPKQCKTAKPCCGPHAVPGHLKCTRACIWRLRLNDI